MLNWLRPRPSDHPLDDRDEAERFVRGFDGKSGFEILEAFADQLDAIKTADHLRPLRAFEIADLLDRAARPYLKHFTAKYVDESQRLTRFQHQRIWFAVMTFLGQLGEAYRTCLSGYLAGTAGSAALRPHLAKVCARAIRSGTAQIKWSYLNYSEVDPEAWEHLAKMYARAESLGLVDEQITLYRGERATTSITQEFIRSLMLGVSAPESLLPIQIEAADRIIARCAPGFDLSSGGEHSARRAIDLRTPLAPNRRKPGSPSPGDLRYFGPGEALLRVSKWKAQLERKAAVDPDLNIGLHVRVPLLLVTFEHLIRHWSFSPQRKQSRRPHRETVKVCHGYADVVANVGALYLESPFASNDEPWQASNASDTGLGLRVAPSQGDWLRVGTLVAVQRRGRSSWDAGVVRRMSGDEGGYRNIGVELFGRGGTSVTVFACDFTARADAGNGQLCILLPGSSNRTDQVFLLMPGSVFRQGIDYELHAYGRRYQLTSGVARERGEDFALVCFQLQSLNA